MYTRVTNARLHCMCDETSNGKLLKGNEWSKGPGISQQLNRVVVCTINFRQLICVVFMLTEHDHKRWQVAAGSWGVGWVGGVWPAGDLQWGSLPWAAHARLPVARRTTTQPPRTRHRLLHTCQWGGWCVRLTHYKTCVKNVIYKAFVYVFQCNRNRNCYLVFAKPVLCTN